MRIINRITVLNWRQLQIVYEDSLGIHINIQRTASAMAQGTFLTSDLQLRKSCIESHEKLQPDNQEIVHHIKLYSFYEG